MPECPLYIKNDTEELVGNVFLSNFDSVEKVVVDSYTRDVNILNLSCTNTIRCTDATTSKFEGFARYLRDRKKAAICKFCNGSLLYILPPKNDTLVELRFAIQSAEKIKPTQPMSRTDQSKSNASITVGSGFLSSLLSQVDSSAKSRVSSAPVVTLSAAAISALSKIENRIRQEIEMFAAEVAAKPDAGASHKKEFEPMEKEEKYIVYDVLNDFESLVGVDEGEGPDRHVVVYQRGFEPDDDIHTLAERSKTSEGRVAAIARRQPQSTSSKRADESLEQRAAADREALLKVNQVKRDRRSIEELQAEMKKKKIKLEGSS